MLRGIFAQGYPGWVFATVTYTLTEDSTLAVKFEAKSGAATPINMAQHSYFNLDGVDSPGTIEDHILQINRQVAAASIAGFMQPQTKDCPDTF